MGAQRFLPSACALGVTLAVVGSSPGCGAESFQAPTPGAGDGSVGAAAGASQAGTAGPGKGAAASASPTAGSATAGNPSAGSAATQGSTAGTAAGEMTLGGRAAAGEVQAGTQGPQACPASPAQLCPFTTPCAWTG